MSEKPSISSKEISDLKITVAPDELGGHLAVDAAQIDVAAQIAAGGYGETISEEEAIIIKRKIDRNLIPLMCMLFFMQYMDKITLSQTAVLGLEQSTHIDANQFNWLSTIFYLSYLIFEYPQSLALQRFPVSKWLSANIFMWSVALCSHAACRNFGGLLAARFVLGMCESVVTASFLIVTSMFYTRAEQMARVGYWYLTTGIGAIVLGFIAFGVLHVPSGSLAPWQWLMIITGITALITSVVFWFFFPDSPTNARFLSAEEKRLAVLRIKVNQTGVENKHFKASQFYEAILDPKTWLFSLIVALSQVPVSLTNQRQLIVNMFGFSTLQTTLLGTVDGVIISVAVLSTTKLSSVFRSFRAYSFALFTLPGIAGGILVITLPFSNRLGLLFSYWFAFLFNGCVPVLLGWVNSVTSGHTKRVTTNGIVLCAYAVGNAVGPFMWKQQYRPRNRIPWAIIVACNAACAVLALLIRAYLAAQNAARDREVASVTEMDAAVVEGRAYDDTFIVVRDETGREMKRRVDRAFLDLTDMQNREFRYVL